MQSNNVKRSESLRTCCDLGMARLHRWQPLTNFD